MCIHGVKVVTFKNPILDFMEELLIDFDEFKNVIDALQGYGFRFISLDEFWQLGQIGFKSKFPFILLTLDDGYQNVSTLISPYLNEKNIPWVLFVSTNHIEKKERLYTYRIKCSTLHTPKSIELKKYNLYCPPEATVEDRKIFFKRVNKIFKQSSKENALEFVEYFDSLLDKDKWAEYNSCYSSLALLTKKQLQSIAKDPLVQIGSHNHSHIILNQNVNEKDIYYEMNTSKKWLEQKLNVNPIAYCYPNGKHGNFSELSKKICKEVGYRLAFTFIGKTLTKQTDLFEIPRYGFPSTRTLKSLLFSSSLPEVVFKIKSFIS